MKNMFQQEFRWMFHNRNTAIHRRKVKKTEARRRRHAARAALRAHDPSRIEPHKYLYNL